MSYRISELRGSKIKQVNLRLGDGLGEVISDHDVVVQAVLIGAAYRRGDAQVMYHRQFGISLLQSDCAARLLAPIAIIYCLDNPAVDPIGQDPTGHELLCSVFSMHLRVIDHPTPIDFVVPRRTALVVTKEVPCAGAINEIDGNVTETTDTVAYQGNILYAVSVGGN
ncbi:MAG: hypothetical protein CVU38_13650 [Chloroflexi bacterium HGW-Chloroflexi-1]|nr:MAG: hypothetical protein CVU38_13650 [Chloroflexi bacterium HGW-Chloroflexi-1]